MNWLIDPKFDAFMAKLQDEEDMKSLGREFAETQPLVFPACSGPCDQGRKICPSPEACQIPSEFSWKASDLVICLIGGLGLILWTSGVIG